MRITNLSYFLIFALIVILTSCEKEREFVSSGSLQYNGQNYTLKTVRNHFYIDSITSEKRTNIAFCTPKMSFTDGKMNGTGALVMLTIASDSSKLCGNVHEILETSYATIISDDKTDTTTIALTSGTVKIEKTEHGLRYEFTVNNGALNGNYEGEPITFYDIDGEQIGELQIGDSIVPLQRGDLMLWGPIFAENLNYYEFYFYSCNLRYTDKGAIQQGLALIVGLHSDNNDAPTNGTYPIGSNVLNQTALYGHKINNKDWGTYWLDYRSTTAQAKTNVLSENISLTHENNIYNFQFDCIDQHGNKITGNYTGDFRVFDVR